MRTHKLRITNIASLKGAHTVDFDRFQNDFGSFAITGDTGSGKSTILNCLSLALYGKSYKGLNQGDFVTLGESAGKVELVFSCSGKRYLSVWGCRVRKKNGEYLKTPSHTKEFYLLSEEGEKKILSCLPEDVIHLDFDQFCKTVVLNQGEFARFLTSSFRERKDILEKLYEGRKLEGFNPLLRQKITELAGKAAAIESKIEGLGHGMREELTEEGLRSKRQKTQELAAVLGALEKICQSLKDTADLSVGIQETKDKLARLETKIQEQTSRLNRERKNRESFAHKAARFQTERKKQEPLLHRAAEHKLNAQKLSTEARKRESLLRTAREETAACRAEASKLKKKARELSDQSSDIEADPLFKEISEQDFENLRRLEREHKEESLRLSSKREFERHLTKQMLELEKERESGRKELAKIDSELAADKADEGRNSLDERRSKLLDLQRLQDRLENFSSELAKKEQTAKEDEKRLALLRAEIAKLEKKQDEIGKQTQIQRDALKSLKLEGARILCLEESLENGGCVVCSNQDISHLNLDAAREGQEKIQAYERNLAALEEREDEVFRELEKTRTAQRALQASLANAKSDIEAASGSFYGSNFSLLNEAGIKENELGYEKAARSLKKQSVDLNDDVQEQEESLRRRGLLEQKRSNLRERAETASRKIKELGERLDLDKEQAKKSASKLAGIEKEAKTLSGAKDFESLERYMDLLVRWRKIASEIQDARQKLGHQEEKLQTLNSREKELALALERQQTEILENEEFVRKVSPDADPEDKLAELEKYGEALEVEREQIDQELKNLEVEKSASFSRRQTLREQLKDQENLILVHWGAYVEAAGAEHPEKAAQDSDAWPLDDGGEMGKLLKALADKGHPGDLEEMDLALDLARKEKERTAGLLDGAKEELAQYKAFLDKQAEAKKQIDKLARELKKTNALREEWEELHLLIGKDEFRNFVLSMVEKLLIQQTNAELAKLCDGRYLIRHKQSSSKLAPDFYIIDKFKGDETRKVSTLSGGETFMVSLAMALALAELTRGNADIESFFIDEGFGTLDQDSLDEALDMLQDIETRGKQIGLISHVKELTRRIPVNIHLQKNRLGNSSIEIVYN